MKTCFKCNIKKELSEFYRHKEMADGHLNKCKSCTKHDSKNNRINNIEYYRKYDKERAMKPHRVEARKIYSKTDNGILARKKHKEKWLNNNSDKRSAHITLNNSIRDGRVIKPEKCQLCGCPSNRLEGHHYDYSEPLKITWLCSKCHHLFHRNCTLSNNTPVNSIDKQ